MKKKTSVAVLSLAMIGGCAAAFAAEGVPAAGTPSPAAAPTARVPVIAGDDDHAPVWETREERDARMKWWRDAKFGMFIHFGLYSGLGGEWQGRPGGAEWIQKNVETDTETYAAAALPLFRPSPDAAAQWAALAKEAGCRYAVFTSKHHEGFALFDSAQTDFDSQDHFGRDIAREFVDAFRGNGMRVGFYHSVIDWHHPHYDYTICPQLCYPKGQIAWRKNRAGAQIDHAVYLDYLENQVRELLTNYGKIDIIWWDYSQGAASGKRGWNAPKLIETARALQPGIIMNNRLYAYSGFDKNTNVKLDLRCGDTMSPEKFVPEKGYPDTDWETCMTVGNRWGFYRYETDSDLKSPETIIRQLQECAAKGGNLLLNIGPRGDGSVPARVAETFRAVGKWLRVNGEAIYGTRPFFGLPGVPASRSADGKSVYVFLPPASAAGTMPALPEGEILGGNADALCPVLKIDAAKIPAAPAASAD